jgi:hypothetical protein
MLSKSRIQMLQIMTGMMQSADWLKEKKFTFANHLYAFSIILIGFPTEDWAG